MEEVDLSNYHQQPILLAYRVFFNSSKFRDCKFKIENDRTLQIQDVKEAHQSVSFIESDARGKELGGFFDRIKRSSKGRASW